MNNTNKEIPDIKDGIVKEKKKFFHAVKRCEDVCMERTDGRVLGNNAKGSMKVTLKHRKE